MSTTICASLIISEAKTTEKEFLWTPETIMGFKAISDVQISPNNDSVLFVASVPQMTEEKGVVMSRIYKANLKDLKSTTPFSAENSNSLQPRWSHDGKWIAFISNRDGFRNLYMIATEGGKAAQLTHCKSDVQNFSWSPCSKYIAFVMQDTTQNEKIRTKASKAVNYKHEGLINRLWVIDISAPENLRPLTTDNYCVKGCGDFGTINTEFDWSLDSKELTFTFTPSLGFDSFYLDSSLATVDMDSGKISLLEKHAIYEAMPRYSPDGKWIAHLSSNSNERYSIDRQIAVRNLKKNEVRLLAKTFNEGPFLAGPSLISWTQDGQGLLFFEPKGTKFHLIEIPLDGSTPHPVNTGEVFFKEPSLSYDKTMLGFVAQSPDTPSEAYVTRLDTFCPFQVSNLNDSLLSCPKTTTEILKWHSKDEMLIEGLLTYPLGYEKGKKYPLLLVIHGGPMGFFDETFLGTPNPYPLAAFAQEGFMILRPNPRGSTGYGKKFRCANYKDWAGADFTDIMSGVDNLITKGLVDSEKLGVMGWSYGGYMTAWTVTQTSRFKAASMGAGCYNLVSMNGTSDLHRFLTDYLGDFTLNRQLYEERSPLNYLSNVTTPCLIQHGTADKRVPVSQGYELYHALENLGKNPTLILYPEMEHRLTDPKMQLDAMKTNLEWFIKHLKNPS